MSLHNTVRLVALLGVLIFLALAVGAYQSNKGSCTQGSAPLRSAVACLVDNDNSANLEGLLACYSDDAVLLPPQGSTIEGKTALRLHYGKIFESAKLSLSMVAVEAKGNGDLGFVRGETEGKVIVMTDGASRMINDKFLAMVKCDSGTWRVTHLMWSPVAAGK